MHVAIAEDGALFRECLVLLETAGRRVSDCFADGNALLAAVADDHVEIAILDIRILDDTLNRIAAGEIVIEPAQAQRLVPSGKNPRDRLLATLSERETSVLRLMAEGRTNTAIASELFVSAKVVENHIAAIFAKLGLPGDATRHHRRVLAVPTFPRAQRVDGIGW